MRPTEIGSGSGDSPSGCARALRWPSRWSKTHAWRRRVRFWRCERERRVGLSGPRCARRWLTAPDKDGQFNSDLIGNLIYVAVVLMAMSLLVTFMAVKIVPTFVTIMKDMSVEVPAPFRRGVAAFSMLVQWWWLGALALVAVVFLLLTGRLQRWVSRSWLGRLTQPWLGYQTADVLQNLSVVTQAGRPMAGTISTLARYHYCPSVRQRLLFVRNELEHGAGLWPSMQNARLVNRANCDCWRRRRGWETFPGCCGRSPAAAA